MQFLGRSICLCILAAAIFLRCPNVEAASEIIYDNTSTPLFDNSFDPPRPRYAEQRILTQHYEYGDELRLGGTARLVTDIFIEYYGNFVATGDEFARLRIYNNVKIYDDYRKSPTDILYESGFFRVTPGYHVQGIPNVNVQVPDVITLSLEFAGLAENEDGGFLLYHPPTVGSSFNEMWRRPSSSSPWLAFTYTYDDPTFKANGSIRIVATTPPLLLQIAVTDDDVQLTWSGEGQNFQVERAESITGPFEPIGTTTQKSWSEPVDFAANAFYRVKQL